MKTVTIATEQQYADDAVRASLRDHVLVFKGNRYGLVFVPAGASARQEFQGPLVAGPWAHAFGLATVLTADRSMSSGAEAARNSAAGTEHVVEVGDVVMIEGLAFEVASGRGFRPEYLRLELLNPLTAPDGDEPSRYKPEGAALYDGTPGSGSITRSVAKAAKADRRDWITLLYTSIDHVRTRRTFATLAGAIAFAERKVGPTPELGSHYAVSPDGIGKIEVVRGTALASLFPALTADLSATEEEEQLARRSGPDFDTRDREGRDDEAPLASGSIARRLDNGRRVRIVRQQTGAGRRPRLAYVTEDVLDNHTTILGAEQLQPEPAAEPAGRPLDRVSNASAAAAVRHYLTTVEARLAGEPQDAADWTVIAQQLRAAARLAARRAAGDKRPRLAVITSARLASALQALTDYEPAEMRARTDAAGVTVGRATFDDGGVLRFTFRCPIATVTAADITTTVIK